MVKIRYINELLHISKQYKMNNYGRQTCLKLVMINITSYVTTNNTYNI